MFKFDEHFSEFREYIQNMEKAMKIYNFQWFLIDFPESGVRDPDSGVRGPLEAENQ